jgi:zinc transport system ATP-binding protein
MPPLLTVRNLNVVLDGRAILRNISFELAQGETLAVIGPNGAGKTVLLRCLLGLVPHQGEIVWAEGVQVGYVPQKIAAERDLPICALDLIAAKASLQRLPTANTERVFDELSLDRLTVRKPLGLLSGGQLQKVLIAFALLGNPQLLLIDEPTASLDEISEERTYDLLRHLQEKRSMSSILVSHELSIVHQFATRVLCLGGAISCLGVPHQVLTPELLRELYGVSIGLYEHHHGGEAAVEE